MSTIRILLGIFCLIAFGCSTEPSSSVLAPSLQDSRHCECSEAIYFPASLQGESLRGVARREAKQSFIKTAQGDCFASFVARNDGLHARNNGSHLNDAARQKILTIARSQIGVREATGNNDGAQVEVYLKVTNLPKGNPWCAAFISWVFKEAGYAQPRTAWSPALLPRSKQTNLPKPADVLGIYSIRLKRMAHAGIVERRQHNWIISIEGNTNVNGSREGDGVYRKWRHIKTIARFADWVRSGT